MFAICASGKTRRVIPGVFTIGLVCIKCRQPNRIGDPFVQIRQGWAHKNCA